MSCNNCHKNLPIVNKKYGLCDGCNYIRLNGQPKQEVYQQRALLKPPKLYKIRNSTKSIRQQTRKEAGVKNQLAALKLEIEMEAVQSDMYYCWGCGEANGALDKSHILSVKQFKHLELEKENINLFCRRSHQDWESGDIMRMGRLLTFEKDLQYIRENSAEYYSKIVQKMQDFLILDVGTELGTKFRRILALHAGS